jgi:hypothetical protein
MSDMKNPESGSGSMEGTDKKAADALQTPKAVPGEAGPSVAKINKTNGDQQPATQAADQAQLTQTARGSDKQPPGTPAGTDSTGAKEKPAYAPMVGDLRPTNPLFDPANEGLSPKFDKASGRKAEAETKKTESDKTKNGQAELKNEPPESFFKSLGL